MRRATTLALAIATGGVAAMLLCACPSAGTDAGSPADAGDEADGGSGADGGEPAPADGGERPTPRDCGGVPAGVTEGRLGASEDVAAAARRLVVLMGGGVEVDAAARRFVEAAAGGDLLVLRASGAVDTYTPWFHDELQAEPPLSSTATLRIDDPTSAGDAHVLCRAETAEALWLAGGDQWDYLGLWPAALQTVIGASAVRGGAIGGTSAGAMILGAGAFDAAEGSVTSAEALADPLASYVSIQTPATAQPELDGMLVDTHFSERDREGRLIAFLAAFKLLTGREEVIGVGLDERASLVIDDGLAEVITDPPDRHVILYRLSGDMTVEAGAPLGLALLDRWTLTHGAQIVWPPTVFDLNLVDQLLVQEGVVSVVSD
jgi:cyanophycinase